MSELTNSTMTATDKVRSVQNETIKDVVNKLNTHHKCLLVRPTGFGKTKTAVDIMMNYNNVVFLYPFNNIANAVRSYNIPKSINLQLYSYSLLRSKHKLHNTFKETFSDFNSEDSIFIMDEAHFIGAAGTSVVIKDLMNNICPKANYLGLTATPNRTDKLEIKWHFFDGITAYEYNLKEAFNDDIYVKPHYVYTTLDGVKLAKEIISKINSLDLSKAKKEQLESKVMKFINPQKLNIENLHEIIENNRAKFENDIDYYKFILFFSTFNDIHNKRNDIVNAFLTVFPHCEINVIIVSSESNRYRLNLNSISNLTRRENTIDLIFNVNMLSFGYHVSDISGIMMFRSTISNIIYAQQIGRCLSVIQKESTIIFDFVENLYKFTPNGVNSNFDNCSSDNNLNKLNLLLPIESVELDDASRNLMDIDRLINNAITEEFEEEVVKAYKMDLVDFDYCVSKLQLQTESDFYKILERYK